MKFSLFLLLPHHQIIKNHVRIKKYRLVVGMVIAYLLIESTKIRIQNRNERRKMKVPSRESLRLIRRRRSSDRLFVVSGS